MLGVSLPADEEKEEVELRVMPRGLPSLEQPAHRREEL